MNSHVHPHMQGALASALIYQRTQAADRLHAEVEVDAPLKFGPHAASDVRGKVWVYREDGRIHIDDIDLEIVGPLGSLCWTSIGTHHDTMRFRALTLAEMQEHVIACAFLDLTDDPEFIESAEIALAEASRP